jgi:predicted enzyme related to lactoylglutathione lyase
MVDDVAACGERPVAVGGQVLMPPRRVQGVGTGRVRR